MSLPDRGEMWPVSRRTHGMKKRHRCMVRCSAAIPVAPGEVPPMLEERSLVVQQTASAQRMSSVVMMGV